MSFTENINEEHLAERVEVIDCEGSEMQARLAVRGIIIRMQTPILYKRINGIPLEEIPEAS